MSVFLLLFAFTKFAVTARTANAFPVFFSLYYIPYGKENKHRKYKNDYVIKNVHIIKLPIV